MLNFEEILNQIKWIPSFDITLIDIVQIIVLAFALYYLTKSLYKTRAWILVKGLLIIGAVYLIICFVNMTVLQIIMQSLFSTLLIAIIIMLQPELQKIVELIGKKGLTDMKAMLVKKQEVATWYSEKTISEIATACKEMSAAKTGALIVIERGIPLEDCINSGIALGSAISSQLLLNIFEKNTPLHDGAVVIRNNRIESATSYLPLSSNYDISKNLGTRHRAALGISESTDCIVVVVSEETGAISVCVGENIKHNINKSELLQALTENMSKHEEIVIGKRKSKMPILVKILAPILSVIIWISVMASNDPISTKTITNIPVTAINTEILDNAGHTYTIKNGNTVSVKIKGKRSLVDNITKDDLKATADFSAMSIVYAVPIEIVPTQKYADIEILPYDDKVMRLEIENMIQTELPIEVKISGNIDSSYFMKLQNVEIDVLTVTCPQSLAKTLDKAVLTVDAYGKDTNFISNVSPVIYDKNGDVVQEGKISMSQDSIRVSIDVYDVKEVPVKVSLARQDKKANAYYEMNGYTAEFETIKIASNDDTMSNLQEIDIVVSPDVNSDNANSMLINLQQYMPDGVYLANGQPEQMSIELDLTKYQKKVVAISASDIKLVGHNANTLSASIVNIPSSIVLYCNTSVVDCETITVAILSPTIKIQQSEVGQYESIITLTSIDGVSIVGELKASYKLDKK